MALPTSCIMCIGSAAVLPSPGLSKGYTEEEEEYEAEANRAPKSVAERRKHGGRERD